jgi:hypothetical protein
MTYVNACFQNQTAQTPEEGSKWRSEVRRTLFSHEKKRKHTIALVT